MKILTMGIDEKLHEQLRAEAFKKKKSMAHIVRESIKLMLEAKEVSKKIKK